MAESGLHAWGALGLGFLSLNRGTDSGEGAPQGKEQP